MPLLALSNQFRFIFKILNMQQVDQEGRALCLSLGKIDCSPGMEIGTDVLVSVSTALSQLEIATRRECQRKTTYLPFHPLSTSSNPLDLNGTHSRLRR
jgi:hypothetical protein